MSLAKWQIRGINRIAQELNIRILKAQAVSRDSSEVIVKFERRTDGRITMQVLDTKTVEVLKAPDLPGAAVVGGDLDREIEPM